MISDKARRYIKTRVSNMVDNLNQISVSLEECDPDEIKLNAEALAQEANDIIGVLEDDNRP